MATNAASIYVLIVDDERLIADTLCLILNRGGFHAKACYSGEQAVEAAKNMVPDVLISDVILGGISGFETALQIRAGVPACRVILFSGHAATAELLHAFEAKGQRFEMLPKPVHPRVILDRLSAFQMAASN